MLVDRNHQIDTFPYISHFTIKEGGEGCCGPDFHIQDSQKTVLGSLQSSWSNEYELKNTEDKTIAKANSQFLRSGIKVSDEEDRTIGVVNKTVCSFFKEYSISNAEKEEIAEVKSNFWHSTFTFSDPRTKVIYAVFTRSHSCCQARWKAEIRPNNPIDTRLLAMFPMFVSKAEKANADSNDKND